MLSKSLEYFKSLKVFSVFLTFLLLMPYLLANASDNPVIEFTYVPSCGSLEDLQGKVLNVIPADYKVAVYVRVSKGWWTKPYFALPLTSINDDGTWTCDITTGGNDQDATEIIAYLIPNGYNPPLMSGECSLPEELEENSVTKVKVIRSCGYRRITFSGYNWRVKSSTSKLGPGPNYFSDSEENVWVDNQGQLHLKINKRGEKWYCAEVILEESFGYGKYVFYLGNRVDILNENIVLGLFTWDDCYDPTYGNREIDIEFSRWAKVDNENAQFVVQPYDRPGNMHRFNMQQDCEESTHSFTWGEDSIEFRSIYDNSVEPWTYTGGELPQPGSENARINLWLFGGNPPSDGEEAEIVIKKFKYIATFPIGDVSGDWTVSAYDASLILQYVVGIIDSFPVQDVTSPSVSLPIDYILRIPEQQAKAGNKIYVPVEVNETKGLFSGGIKIKYDPTILRAVNVLTDSSLQNAYWKANKDINGEVRFAFATMKPMEGQGNLFIVEFEVLPNTEGITSLLTLDYVKLSESLSIKKKNGSVNVLPSQSMLLQNYPNPFNPETWMPFKLSDDADVVISIYDVKGKLVRKIGLGEVPAGFYVSKDKAAYWNGKNSYGERVASGIYYYTLQTCNFSATKRMLILK